MANTVSLAGKAGPGDRRTRRRAQAQDEIVAAAWQLVRESGLAGLSMRELGARVGMRAQSVYAHFASKDEILDAMFRQGCEQYLASLDRVERDHADDPRALLRALAHDYFDFCVAEPVRFQLLFLRTVPGFTPSPGSYALAVETMDRLQTALTSAGITDPAAPALATALLTGMASQQLANDPGGDTWGALVDRAVSMLLVELTATPPGSAALEPGRKDTT